MELLLLSDLALSLKLRCAAVEEETAAVVACRVCRQGTDVEFTVALTSLVAETEAATVA